MKQELQTNLKALSLPLLALSATSLALITVRLLVTGSLRYWFLPWNLLLAWIPFLLGFATVYAGKKYRWTSWQFVASFTTWLLLFPNTFYLITDLIHLHTTGEVSVLYDAVMMSMFVITGVLLGLVSLWMIEKELRRGFRVPVARGIVLGIILLASFAVYLGRYLRWNSWDVVLNPGGILLDTADRLLRPYSHPEALTTTALFFVAITSLYFGLKAFVRAAKKLG